MNIPAAAQNPLPKHLTGMIHMHMVYEYLTEAKMAAIDDYQSYFNLIRDIVKTYSFKYNDHSFHIWDRARYSYSLGTSVLQHIYTCQLAELLVLTINYFISLDPAVKKLPLLKEICKEVSKDGFKVFGNNLHLDMKKYFEIFEILSVEEKMKILGVNKYRTHFSNGFYNWENGKFVPFIPINHNLPYNVDLFKYSPTGKKKYLQWMSVLNSSSSYEKEEMSDFKEYLGAMFLPYEGSACLFIETVHAASLWSVLRGLLFVSERQIQNYKTFGNIKFISYDHKHCPDIINEAKNIYSSKYGKGLYHNYNYEMTNVIICLINYKNYDYYPEKIELPKLEENSKLIILSSNLDNKVYKSVCAALQKKIGILRNYYEWSEINQYEKGRNKFIGINEHQGFGEWLFEGMLMAHEKIKKIRLG